ncbi:MAG: hypothetical protein PHD55_04635 [Methanoregula sp.]|jgi:hypothetical protein|nr:hypothetical protein [Methanoregula sp.]
MCSDITAVTEQDTTVAVLDDCADSPDPDTSSDSRDLFTDNKGRSYISVRSCELDRFCSK